MCRTTSILVALIQLFSFLAMLNFPEVVSADNAYRWKDSSGRVIYGSRPPKGAKSAAQIETPKLSRYSADKVLRRLGKEVPSSSRARLSRGGSKQTAAGAFAQGTTEADSFEAARLEHGKILVGRDADQAIMSCNVNVKNAGISDATDVSVAFEFSDGSLVPAVGPTEISAGEESMFEIPRELTPLKLRLPDDQIERMLQEPRVVVHGLATVASATGESATGESAASTSE